MPRLVNHESHRAKVIAFAFDIIAADGLPALTFRALAARMQCSTSAVSYYFKSRTELLQAVYRAVNLEASGPIYQLEGFENRTPISLLEHILPNNERSRKLWRVWISFWLGALSDPALLAEHRAGLDDTRNLLHDYLVGCGAPAILAEVAAEDLLQATLGISMQALFDPDAWPHDRQLAAYQRAARRVWDQVGAAAPV